MTNVPFDSIEAFRDIESLNHYAEAVGAGEDPEAVLASMRPMSRDNARTPMQWDDSPHAGFTTGEPWIAVNPNHSEINAREARADPGSVFHHYRRLIELRHDEPAVANGDFTMLLEDDPQVYASRAGSAAPSCSWWQRLRRARERGGRPGRRALGGCGAADHKRARKGSDPSLAVGALGGARLPACVVVAAPEPDG